MDKENQMRRGNWGREEVRCYGNRKKRPQYTRKVLKTKQKTNKSDLWSNFVSKWGREFGVYLRELDNNTTVTISVFVYQINAWKADMVFLSSLPVVVPKIDFPTSLIHPGLTYYDDKQNITDWVVPCVSHHNRSARMSPSMIPPPESQRYLGDRYVRFLS